MATIGVGKILKHDNILACGGISGIEYDKIACSWLPKYRRIYYQVRWNYLLTNIKYYSMVNNIRIIMRMFGLKDFMRLYMDNKRVVESRLMILYIDTNCDEITSITKLVPFGVTELVHLSKKKIGRILE